MKKVLAVLVLDESGSMDKICDQTISSTNEYIDSLRPRGKECHITLVKFNSEQITTLCDNSPAKDCPRLTRSNYHPNAITPLLDAVGQTIRRVESQIKNYEEGMDVLFVVITDGEENDSKEYTVQSMAKLVSEKESQGWTFTYLGANQDSWQSASSIGYRNAGNIRNFEATQDGIVLAMSAARGATHSYLRDRQAFYTQKMADNPDINLTKISYQATNFYKNNEEEEINAKSTKRSLPRILHRSPRGR